MNANELADELREVSKHSEPHTQIVLGIAESLLRQQEVRIKQLEDTQEYLYKTHDADKAEIEALKNGLSSAYWHDTFVEVKKPNSDLIYRFKLDDVCKHGVDDGACKECYQEVTHPVKEHFEDEPQAEELHEILQSNAELTPCEELRVFQEQQNGVFSDHNACCYRHECRIVWNDWEKIRSNPVKEQDGCGNCHACLVGVTEHGLPVTFQRMILCPDCGNKRCPKASNHRYQCTESNKPNQRGSIYTHPVEEQDESFDRTASHMAGEYVSWTSCVACGQRVTGDSIHTCSPQLKQLTDEEMIRIYEKDWSGIKYGLGRAVEQAILLKAQEK